MKDSNQTKPHAIVIPFMHYQGHITPTLNLALKLATNGFKITYVNTQLAHVQMTKNRPDNDIFIEARKSGLDINYKVISDGFPLSFDRTMNLDSFIEGFFDILPAHVDELVGTLIGEDSSVSCLIADTLHQWSTEIAKKYNLVNISFWTQPALVFNLNYHLDLLKINGHYACPNGNREDIIDYIPGVKAIEPKDLMPYLQVTNVPMKSPRIKWLYTSFEKVKNADFIICNTIDELEYEVIRALNQKQPFYSIGPIFPPMKDVVPTNLSSETDCVQWLNKHSKGSVLYVSFGSLISSNEGEMEEIAHGLALANVKFIWVHRPNKIGNDRSHALLSKLQDKFNGKGLIVPWCNQVQVLSHSSIGGFLTHCGWNSVMEGARFGVPMLCFPKLWEQNTNQKIVVDDWKLGIRLFDQDNVLTREKLAEKINYVMGKESSKELRFEAEKVKYMIKNITSVDGSLERNMRRFIDDVKAKIKGGNMEQK